MREINVDTSLLDIDKTRLLAHLDHSNPNSFEVEDLSRLIKQVGSWNLSTCCELFVVIYEPV